MSTLPSPLRRCLAPRAAHPLPARRLRLLGLRTLGIGALGLSLGGPAEVHAGRRGYPTPNGYAKVEGLHAPARAIFDGLGVPHIEAADLDDAATLLGFLHARDRGFQLELLRLAGQGRLSELFGDRMLEVDRRLRLLTFGVPEVLAALPAPDRARLVAYCAGVNAGLAATPRPRELRLLRRAPAPWTPADVLGVARLQAWDLSGDAEAEALRDLLLSAVPPEYAAALLKPSAALGAGVLDANPAEQPRLPRTAAPPEGLPLRPLSDPPAPTDRQGRSESRPTDGEAKGRARRAPAARSLSEDALADATLRIIDNLGSGSNGWAVAGSRTHGGKPMLAGDPHLALGWPPVFYEAHIRTPEIDVSGATFPGLPMVVIGRAAGVAWTLTTSYADTQDLYRLRVLPDGNYEVDGKAEAFTAWPQTFVSKKGPPRAEVYRLSRFGPVYNAGREDRLRPDQTYALSWPGFSTAPLPITSAFDGLYAARTAEEAAAAIATLPYPSQSWIFATINGDIGWVLGGDLPLDRASPLPRDGARSDSGPQGPRMDADRPMQINPPEGIVVASNQPIAADAARTGTTFSGGWRALRIHQVLSARGDWSPAAMRGLQTDRVSLEAAAQLPALIAAVGDPSGLSADAQALLGALSGWDYALDGDAAAPLAWSAWRTALHQQVAAGLLESTALQARWLGERMSEQPVWDAIVQGEGALLWDAPRSPEREGMASVARAALEAGAAALVEAHGRRPEGWRWGEAHRLQLDHPLASVPLLGRRYRVEPTPIGGGRHTIAAFNDGALTGDPDTRHGPALRQVVELGGEAGFVLPGGNAGQPGHPHALDQLPSYIVNQQHVAGPDSLQVHALLPRQTVTLEPAETK